MAQFVVTLGSATEMVKQRLADWYIRIRKELGDVVIQTDRGIFEISKISIDEPVTIMDGG
jgi:hypothetical protein